MKRFPVRLLPYIALVGLLTFIVLLNQTPLPSDVPTSLDRDVSGWPPSLSRDITLYVRPNATTVLIRAAHVCSTPRLLLVVVCSAVNNADLRLAIRETWASVNYVGQSARVVFFLGASTSADVREESVQYGDIVQEDFVDSYNNLTVKTVMMLKWVQAYCPGMEFIMKADDDTFVNVLAVTSILQSQPVDLLGFLIQEAPPNRDSDSKWYTPTYMFADSTFPDYLSGTGYVMSREVVGRLYAAALVTPVLHLEDVYLTGICARHAGLKPSAHSGFSYRTQEFAPCGRLSDLIVTSHRMNMATLHRGWCMMGEHCTDVTNKLTLKQRAIRFLMCQIDRAGFTPPDLKTL